MYITWSQLALLAAFILLSSLCIYLILLIRSLSASVKEIRVLLKDNSGNIDATLKDLPVISKNLVDITETVKTEVNAVEATIKNFGETAEATAATASIIKNDIFGKAKSVIELVDAAKRLFTVSKAAEKEKED